MWCNDNAYKPLAARTVSMTLKKHADEFGLEHDNHIQNTLGKRVNGFWSRRRFYENGLKILHPIHPKHPKIPGWMG